MPQVLSQDEIDALLKGIESGDTEEAFDTPDIDGNTATPYDLISQDRIIRSGVPTLETIHERFARMFQLTLSSAPRKVVNISVRSTELIKFGEFLKTLPVPSSLNLFRMNPLRGNALMVLETRLVFALIDLLLGGTGESEVKAKRRDFTPIEQKIVKRAVVSALEDIQNAWRPVFPVQVTYTRSETNPQFLAIVAQSDMVVVVTVDVAMGKAPMTLCLCIPCSMIEPIHNKLDPGFQANQNEEDHVLGNRLRDNIREACVNILVELGHAELSAEDFLKLKVGDIVLLNQESSEPLDILVEGVPKFKGFQGSYKGNQAVKIAGRQYSPPIKGEFDQ